MPPYTPTNVSVVRIVHETNIDVVRKDTDALIVRLAIVHEGGDSKRKVSLTVQGLAKKLGNVFRHQVVYVLRGARAEWDASLMPVAGAFDRIHRDSLASGDIEREFATSVDSSLRIGYRTQAGKQPISFVSATDSDGIEVGIELPIEGLQRIHDALMLIETRYS